MTRVVRDRRRIAMIGLGEAGRLFAKGLLASGLFDVAGYDALLEDPASAPAVRAKISSIGITECSSLEQACRSISRAERRWLLGRACRARRWR